MQAIAFAARLPGHGLAIPVLAALVWTACIPAWAGTLEGTAAYRERIALPPDAVFISAGAGQRPSPGQPRAPGRIDVPASYEGELPGAGGGILWHLDLLPLGRYQLRTTYKNRPEPNRFDDIGRWRQLPDTGRLLLRGGRGTPLTFIPDDGGRTLRKADITGKPVASNHNGRLQRLAQLSLIEPRLALTGMFTYMADAAAITLCADGGRLPVAMEADYKALEAAYLKERREPGQALLVSLEGLIAPRPSMEANRPPRPTLVVERFISAWPRESCGEKVERYRVSGSHLEMLDAAGLVLARFEAVALR